MMLINPNIISLTDEADQLQDISKRLPEEQVDVCIISKQNIDTAQQNVQNLILDTVIHSNTINCVQVASSPMPSELQYKPDGTMMLTLGDSTGCE
eukprot:10965579-Ditylum_brightwellii.AAC.1